MYADGFPISLSPMRFQFISWRCRILLISLFQLEMVNEAMLSQKKNAIEIISRYRFNYKTNSDLHRYPIYTQRFSFHSFSLPSFLHSDEILNKDVQKNGKK